MTGLLQGVRELSRIQVRVIHQTGEGMVTFITNTKDLIVDFPEESTSKMIQEFLTTKRHYRIPKGRTLDDYREEDAMPTDSFRHMELALCSMFAEIGVWVDWKSQQHSGECPQH